MTSEENTAPTLAATPPGWYRYGTEPEPRWWDGTSWSDPAVLAEALAKRTGELVVQIPEGKGKPTLNLYQNEVWKTMPLGHPGTVGGSIAGARAEVVVQNQIAQRSISVRLRTVNTTLLHVTAPSFEFTFSIAGTLDQWRMKQFNHAAEFINNRAKELLPTTSMGTPIDVPSIFSAADELAKFAGLRDAGVITDEEFATKKEKLLS